MTVVTFSAGMLSGKFEFRFIMIKLVVLPLLDIVTVFAIVVTHEPGRYLIAVNIVVATSASER